MLEIEFIKEIDKDIRKLKSCEFRKYARKNDIDIDFTEFNFIAKENGDVVGILMGCTLYGEVQVEDLIVFENHRGKGIGTKLMQKVETHFKDKEFDNINLVTSEFQSPEFYKKLGYEVEFVRKNKKNPKLTKYFFVKYF